MGKVAMRHERQYCNCTQVLEMRNKFACAANKGVTNQQQSHRYLQGDCLSMKVA